MIKRKSLCFTLGSCDATGITCIGTVYRSRISAIGWHIQHHVSSAASLFHVLLLLHFLLNQSLKFLVVLHTLHLCCTLERRHRWRELLAYLVQLCDVRDN